MGWDAFAQVKRYPTTITILSTKIRKAFKEASDAVSKYSAVDGGLKDGILGCRTCGDILSEATGFSVYTETWTVDRVIDAHMKANWDKIDTNSDDAGWALRSAKAFLGVCAKHKLGIKFSW